MKRSFFLIGLVMLALGLFFCGCTRRAESSQEAIETAQAMETVEEQVDYLVNQAKAFYNSEEFQQAVNIAQHILRHLDRDSQEARSLLDEAREALATQAKEAISGFGQ